MKRFLFILLIILHSTAFSQQKELKSFFQKYFMDLDNSQYYTEWVRKLSEDNRLERDLSDSSLNKRGVVCYKIKKNSLLKNDSTQAALHHILKTEYQASSGQASDSLFTIVLRFNYGMGKNAKKMMNKTYRMVLKEKINYTSISNVETRKEPGDVKDENYIGQAYDFNNKKIIPAPLMIARSKPGTKEKLLLIYCFTHYGIRE